MKTPVLVTRELFPAAMEFLSRHVEVALGGVGDLGAHEGLICQLTDRVSAAEMDRAPELKVIATVAVGYDNIDLSAARARNIVVTNTPDVLTETTADLAWALLMAAARRIVEADRFLRAGKWRAWEVDLLCGHDLHGRTLGVIGAGRIGRAVARRAQGFGMRVIACDRNDPLDELLAESDFVSLHVPLTPGTRGLIGAAELQRMKPTAILINTARGQVVDEAALVDALRTGAIAGAGLDVFENEPRVHPGLLELDNVVLTPHIGSASIATRERMCLMAAEDCVAVLQSRAPTHPVQLA